MWYQKPTKKVKLRMPYQQNTFKSKSQILKFPNTITHFDIPPDGKKNSFVSRRQFICVIAKVNFTKPIGNQKTGRTCLEAKCLKDNATRFNLPRTHQGLPSKYIQYPLAKTGNEKKNNKHQQKLEIM